MVLGGALFLTSLSNCLFAPISRGAPIRVVLVQTELLHATCFPIVLVLLIYVLNTFVHYTYSGISSIAFKCAEYIKTLHRLSLYMYTVHLPKLYRCGGK